PVTSCQKLFHKSALKHVFHSPDCRMRARGGNVHLTDGNRGRPRRNNPQESMSKAAHIRKSPLTVEGVQLSCEHGLRVFLVDGTAVRNDLDSDFISGSSGVFRFIPKGELWIDESVPEEELHFLVENECVLAAELARGRTIEQACSSAQRAESSSRRLEHV